MDLKSNSSNDKKTYEDYINSFDQDEKSKVKEIFDLFDKNLDGNIDLKELKFIMNCIFFFFNFHLKIQLNYNQKHWIFIQIMMN